MSHTHIRAPIGVMCVRLQVGLVVPK